jgi:hypothetical protein
MSNNKAAAVTSSRAVRSFAPVAPVFDPVSNPLTIPYSCAPTMRHEPYTRDQHAACLASYAAFKRLASRLRFIEAGSSDRVVSRRQCHSTISVSGVYQL